jgi:hypothetical protein
MLPFGGAMAHPPRSLLIPLFGVLLGCGTSPPEDGIERRVQPVIDGAPSDHTGVVLVETPTLWCTGWAVLPNLVMTARHCVSTLAKNGCDTKPVSTLDSADVRVSEAKSITGLSTYVDADRILVLDELESSPRSLCGNDIALIVLSSPLQQATLVEPRLDLPPRIGESVAVIGYGQTGDGDPITAGFRREFLDAEVTTLGPVTNSSGVRATEDEFVVSKGPCLGDSGGPLLDVAGRVVGNMSRGDGKQCVDMIYEMLTPHSDWIRESAIAVAEAASIEPPAWTVPPADGSVGFGDRCRGISECEAPFGCLPVGDQFLCTTDDCALCPAEAECQSKDGSNICVPPVMDAGADTGPDAEMDGESDAPVSDAMMSEDALADEAGGSETQRGGGNEGGGCAMSGRRSVDPNALMLLAIAAAMIRRRFDGLRR